MVSNNIEDTKKDPFRKTPWIGRLLIAAFAKIVAFAFAFVFRDAEFPAAANSFAFALAVINTIVAIIFVGRVGTMVPGRGRLYFMVATTYVVVLASRILPKLWQTSFLSVQVLSFGSLIGLALLQIPNIIRAIELRNGEAEVYRKRNLDDPARFHRCGL